MIKLLLLTGLMIIVLTLPTQAQVKSNGEQEVLLSARNGKAVLVPPGSSNFSVSILADPPANKQETFDIVSENAAAIVTLILPNGTEVNASNATSLGYNYTVATLPFGNEFQSVSPFFTNGTHTLIVLPVGAPAGNYQIKINTSNISTETFVTVSYYSSSSVRTTLLTDASTYRIDDIVILSGIVFDGTTAVTGATVTALICDQNNPGAEPIQVVLQDSGVFDNAPGDGIYTGTFTASSAGTFIAAMRVNGTSASGVSYSRLAATPFKVIGPAATFSSFSDASVDDNSNGRPDRIAVTSTINVQTAGNYFFYAQLYTSNGAKLVSKARAMLQAGTRQMEISFSIDELRSLNANGPYTLKNATLIYEDDLDMPVVDFRENVATTQSYQLSTFERNPYLFVGPNTVEGYDFDGPGNGKFDYLRVKVPVDFLYDGVYYWSAALLDSSGEEITYYSTVETGLSAGRHDLEFYFNGQDISRSQKNGPYTIGRIGIGGATGSPRTPIGKDGDGSLDFLMTTPAYSYTQFEPPLRVKCSSFSTSAPPGQTSAIINYTLPAVTGQKDIVTLTCTPPPGSSFNGGTTAVNCTAVEAGTNLTATCSFNITLYTSGTDTSPPTITAPTIAYAVIPYGQSSAPAYYYPTPTATDDSGAVTLTCSITSGATLSRGLTYVNCTATDSAGNQSTATFPLRVFDINLQDDESNNTLWFDSVTGDYYFFSCDGTSFNVAGRGSITLQNCQVKLNDPRVTATFIGCSYTTSGRRGSAVVKPNPVSGWYYITDSNANDNTTTCPLR